MRADGAHLAADRVGQRPGERRAPTCSQGRSPAGRPSRRAPSARSRSPRGRSPGCRAGSPRRGSAGSRWRAPPLPRRRSELAPGDPRDVTDPVAQDAGCAPGRELRRPRASWNTQALPSCATFSSRRHRGRGGPRRRSCGDRPGSRYAGVTLSIRVTVIGSPRLLDTSRGRRACVGSLVWVEATGSPSISPIRRRVASKPICWIGCSIVVSGGSLSADSGTLSNPITERSSGTRSPSERAIDDRRERRDVVRGEDRGGLAAVREQLPCGVLGGFLLELPRRG